MHLHAIMTNEKFLSSSGKYPYYPHGEEGSQKEMYEALLEFPEGWQVLIKKFLLKGGGGEKFLWNYTMWGSKKYSHPYFLFV